VRRLRALRHPSIPPDDVEPAAAPVAEKIERLTDMTAGQALEPSASFSPGEAEGTSLSMHEVQKLEALGRLAAGVAHDFNNLLSVISGYCDRLTLRLPEGADKASVREISAAADRGAALVRQLLAFSRPQPVELRRVDLNGVVHALAPMLRRVVGEDVDLEIALDRRPLPVDVDTARIDQVLVNLVVNARDAMPGGGRVTITTALVDGDDLAPTGFERRPEAMVAVTDTGVGMDAETQARVFEPFFTTKGAGQGSGLGLATARALVAEAGGALTVASAPGDGATFRFRLPLADAPAAVAEEVQAGPSPAGGHETILLVEDEPALRELEQVTLEDAGYSVIAVGNPDQAIELADRHDVDLVVADVVLPSMSGPSLVEELRLRGQPLPAVFVSGYGADAFERRGLAAPAAVLQKPFRPEALLAAVRNVLDTAPEPIGAVAPPPGGAAQPVRCLACSTRYWKVVAHDTVSRSWCPQCGYVGWARAE